MQERPGDEQKDHQETDPVKYGDPFMGRPSGWLFEGVMVTDIDQANGNEHSGKMFDTKKIEHASHIFHIGPGSIISPDKIHGQTGDQLNVQKDDGPQIQPFYIQGNATAGDGQRNANDERDK